jgi:hypothetical protein
MIKRIARWLGNKCLDFIEAIYQNRPDDSRMTAEDFEMRQKARAMRKDFQ